MKKKFRNLTENEEKVSIIKDYRIQDNQKVIILCEHATQNFHDFNLSENDKKFIDTHWAYDIGALKIMNQIAEKSKLFSLATNFSRLLIDPNRILISNSLVRKTVEISNILDLNKDVDENERIQRFYLPYYSVLKDSLNFIKPKYICSIHSFTKQYENNSVREMDVGLLVKDENSDFSKIFIEVFSKYKINYRLNEPYKYKDSDTAFDSLTKYNYPEKTEGILIEIRNDLTENEEFVNTIVNVISECLNKLSD